MWYNQILPSSKLLKRNLNFIGREEYLNQIEKAFIEEKKQLIIFFIQSEPDRYFIFCNDVA